MNRTLSLVLVSLLVAAGCSRDAAEAERPLSAKKPADIVLTAPLPSFQGKFTDQAALVLLLKDVDKPIWKEQEKHLSFEKDQVPQYAAGIGQFPFRQQGSDRLLFVFEAAPLQDNDCHACGVSVGAAVFSHEGDSWRVETSKAEVTSYNNWGESADGAVSLVKIGPDNYAVSKAASGGNQGYTAGGVSLFEVKPGFPGVLTVLLAEDNEGVCTEDLTELRETAGEAFHPCYKYSGKVSLVRGSNAEYDDVKVVFSGTHAVGPQEKLVTFSDADSDRYVYRDGKYVKVEGTERR